GGTLAGRPIGGRRGTARLGWSREPVSGLPGVRRRPPRRLDRPDPPGATRRLRFWGSAIDVRAVAAKVVDVDYRDHLTLLVLQGGDEGRMIGGAQYIRTEGGRAEISLSVADEFQNKGIGSILLGQLAQAAAEQGITTFVADVLPENHTMVNVFRNSGFPVSI